MDTALSWIKSYVPELSCTDQEYRDAMTLTGTKVESFRRLDKNLENIVVGKVLSVERHPDAEKLVVCQVDVGTETTQIVTGAPNVEAGQLVPVVLSGGRVAGGHDGGPLPEEGIKIKAGKLRGVESNGMMCSIEELGSDKNFYPEQPEGGIYVFLKDVKPGDDAIAALGMRDSVFEYEITSNRVDCYSVIGIAREAAATFRKPFVMPEYECKGNDEKASDYISVEVKDPDLCPRYIARVVKNIKIAPSPEWMQRRLAASGIRPINNLVDITNYVMEEFGQPMHAYDLDKIAGKKIIVQRANDGEKFTTLDGQERNLDHDMLMICDAEKAVGLAGIMGGENSMITDDVKNVLFEAATFIGSNIRKSARRAGLRTDASGKFEKGLDPRNAEAAINRACRLIEELGCGEVVGGIVDVCEPIPELRRITFEPDRYNALLGTDVSESEMLDIFKMLEIEYDKAANELIIPSFRQDLVGYADIAEEVARFHGYDKIPTTLPKGSANGGLNLKMRVEGVARDVAEYCGFSQAYVYSFESPKVFDKLLLPADDERRKTVTISNPLGEDFSVMRTLSLNGMLTSLSTNFNRRNTNVRLYELGNIYLPKSVPVTDYPDERMQFTLGFYGDGDFFSMKGAVEEFFDKAGIKEKRTYNSEDKDNKLPFLHPGRRAFIECAGKVLGYLGEVHPAVCDNYNIKTRVYVAVIDMPEVLPLVTFTPKFKGLAKFPAVSRDISMVVPKSVSAGDIEGIISQRGGKILEEYKLFDIYEGSQIEEGFKSMAYSVTFRAADRTLQDEEVGASMKKILNGLESLGIKLRQ